MEFEFVKRHEVLKTPEYTCELDEYRRGQDAFLLAHIRVDVWSASAFKRLLHQFQIFRTCVTAPLFALCPNDDDKWERFVSRLGFVFHQHVTCQNGERRRLFINPPVSHARQFKPIHDHQSEL